MWLGISVQLQFQTKASSFLTSGLCQKLISPEFLLVSFPGSLGNGVHLLSWILKNYKLSRFPWLFESSNTGDGQRPSNRNLNHRGSDASRYCYGHIKHFQCIESFNNGAHYTINILLILRLKLCYHIQSKCLIMALIKCKNASLGQYSW